MRLVGLVIVLGSVTACAPNHPPSRPVPAAAPVARAVQAPSSAPSDVAAAEAAVSRARTANERWEFEPAVRELEPALATFERALPRGDRRIEQALMALARAHRGAGHWELAERAVRRAGGLAADANDPAEQLLVQNELALIYEESGRVDEAIAVFQAALDGASERQGTDLEDAKLTTEHNLGFAYSDRGDYRKAEVMLERVLVADRAHDPRSVETANTLNNLALAYRDDRQLDKAKTMFEEALAILTEELGPEHVQLGPTLTGLAGTLKLQHDLAGAEAMYRRALALGEANGTFDYIAAEDLADVQTDRGHPEEALALLAKSLAAQQARSEYPRDEIVRTLVKRLRAHLKLGDFTAAEADSEAAISTSRQANANKPAQVRATIDWVARSWRLAGKPKRAAQFHDMTP